MRNGIAIIFLIVGFQVYSQELRFVDAQTQHPVEGVSVAIKEAKGTELFSMVSDARGIISLVNRSFPLIISASHLSYEYWSDTLKQASKWEIKLEHKEVDLGQVVVTGQFRPQQLDQSVFNVRVIDQAEIQQRNAVSLSEVLNNSLNIRLTEDLAVGSTNISLLGTSGQNVKILLDGVPLVNRNGNGNAADLSQVNLNQIERIEIVEGPMAVNYGANALAGVINLISKKPGSQKTEVQFIVQEESAGSEYALDRGRHIQSLAINHQLSKHFTAQLGLQRNDFSGFKGSAETGQFEWNPKLQWQSNALLRYEREGFKVYYRLDYLNELITDFGRRQNNFLPNGENQPFSINEEYHTQRYIHQLQFSGNLSGGSKYQGYVSYSDFERDKSRFSHNLITDDRTLTTGEGDQDVSSYQVWELGGTWNQNWGGKLSLQSGYQLTLEEVGGGRIAEGNQSVENLALFTSLEWAAVNKLQIRPGLRLAINSGFGNEWVPSAQVKYKPGEAYDLRFSYGRGFRAPSVRERFFEFVDTNHRIFGNPDLQPEFSNFLSLDFEKKGKLYGRTTNTRINGFYNSIIDQIATAQSLSDVTAVTYFNIDRFKTLGFRITQEVQLKSMNIDFGFAYVGRSNRFEDADADLEAYLYTPEFNLNLSGNLDKLSFGVYYKYSGRIQGYSSEEDSNGFRTITLNQIDGFHWLDVNANHPLGKRLNVSAGIRNLTNMRNINNSGIATGSHGAGSALPISYGRSFLIKIQYKLSINE